MLVLLPKEINNWHTFYKCIPPPKKKDILINKLSGYLLSSPQNVVLFTTLFNVSQQKENIKFESRNNQN